MSTTQMRPSDLSSSWDAEPPARMSLYQQVKRYLTRDVCLSTFLLFVAYGMGSWVTINGIFSELPIIVYNLPESWASASYIVLIIQVGNVGPLIYILGQKFISLRVANVAVLLIGIISMLFLINYWDSFSIVNGGQHSTGLFVLTFFASIADATTSVVFWPFIASFHHAYIPAILLGEGLSGFIPAALTWIQNPNPGEIVFSTNLYFGLLAILLGISLTGFFFLDRIPANSPARNKNSNEIDLSIQGSEGSSQELQKPSSTAGKLLSDAAYGSSESFATTAWNIMPNLVILWWISFCQNGVKPSILSYATIPFGPNTYQYATNASLCIDPILAFFTFFYLPSRRLVVVLCLVWTGMLAFLLAMALQSPNPPWANSDQGNGAAISMATLCSGFLSVTKAATIRRLQMIHTVASASVPPSPEPTSLVKILTTSDPYSSRLHRICVGGVLPILLGIWVQAGSICGAILFYFLVNNTTLFVQSY